MLQKLQKLKRAERQKGFTIIEILIVLAIAGLILLIVFLAVPALQRNSRNTQRKNDVSAILSGLSEYSANNGGGMPTACSGSTTVTWGAAGSAQNDTKLGYFNSGCATTAPTGNGVVYLNTAAGAGAITGLSSNTQDYVEVVEGDVCSGTGAAKGSARSIAVLYEIETSGGFTGQCEQS